MSAVRWFVDDDAGYLDWLHAHPTGHVLNTTARPTASYLILHLAACRIVNRPQPRGKRWTHSYGKACADSAEQLVIWARQTIAGEPAHCRLCLG